MRDSAHVAILFLSIFNHVGAQSTGDCTDQEIDDCCCPGCNGDGSGLPNDYMRGVCADDGMHYIIPTVSQEMRATKRTTITHNLFLALVYNMDRLPISRRGRLYLLDR